MKITLIHGQARKESTYHIARMTAEKIGGQIDEFFLPNDGSDGCFGCFACMEKGRELCPHSKQISLIFNSMLGADVIIIGSPTYVLEMTGHLKSFFDHLFSAWLSHRPERAMFSKTAVVISTAAGIGMGGVTRSLSKQLFYLGVPKVYRFPVRVAATSWNDVQNKAKIEAKASKIARQAISKTGRAKPGLKLRLMFSMMRRMHKNNDWSPLDKEHWKENGWLDGKKPWRD
ncbi:MAG: NAD(P)H-dependent oxidoreductase [Oscillospiraceae bacterium]|nr:NAD(P)H-dependent oxidoreductase [Oscillospiraceae bacterium]